VPVPPESLLRFAIVFVITFSGVIAQGGATAAGACALHAVAQKER